MNHGVQPEGTEEPGALARALEPALQAACGGRLIGPVQWFHASWQRGGAATGKAHWTVQDRPPLPVLIKLPVGPAELSWTTRLGHHGPDRDLSPGHSAHPTPMVLASGDGLGGYDLGWLVSEWLEGTPVSGGLSEASLTGLIEAAAEFQLRAGAMCDAAASEARRPEPDLAAILERSAESVQNNALPDAHRWSEAIKSVRRRVADLAHEWADRPQKDWCHGDLHPGNAMHMPGRDGTPDRCVLIDLGLVHPGHWVQDAVYLEHVFWGHEDRLGEVEPVRLMRQARRARGLPARESDGRLANIRRLMTAAGVPARLVYERGDRRYLEAALGHIERLLVHLFVK